MTANSLASGSRARFRACWRWSASTPIRLQSREHILLSNVISTRWHKGENLTLALLIEDIQTPPFAQVGVVDLESFFPEKKRTELAMAVNSLLAAPGFQTWLTGVPLDLKSMLHTPEGKPRLGIFSIAHLSDSERMFFVSLLLNECIAWMRRQSGTTSLRALLYMDEIFGYLPPTANPPSKKPMLVLLKQGRAFGFGVLLATQNPVDLDYKALANMGTWWLGRLQTERDKARVLDGLEGAAAAQQHGFDRGQIDRMLSGLGNRIFLMNNAHEDHPVLFQVRWCMSYLRGPLTRNQIKSLMDPMRKRLIPGTEPKPSAAIRLAGSVPAAPKVAPILEDAAADAAPLTAAKPTLSKGIPELFLPANSANPNKLPVVCIPHLLRAAEILFSDAKKGLSGKKKVTLLDPLRPKQGAFSFTETTRLEERGARGIQRRARSCDRRVPAAAAVCHAGKTVCGGEERIHRLLLSPRRGGGSLRRAVRQLVADRRDRRPVPRAPRPGVARGPRCRHR